MTNRIIRLRAINSRLDPVINFARPYDDEDEGGGHPLAVGIGTGAGVAGAGYGAYRLNKSVRASMAANPGMTYGGGLRDVGASSLARTAGAIRGTRDAATEAAKTAGASVAGAARTAGSSVAGAARTTGATAADLYGRGMAGIRSGYSATRSGLSTAAQSTAKGFRKTVAGVGAGYRSVARSVESEGLKNILKSPSMGGAILKKVGQAGWQAAKHTLSVEERLIMLSSGY